MKVSPPRYTYRYPLKIIKRPLTKTLPKFAQFAYYAEAAGRTVGVQSHVVCVYRVSGPDGPRAGRSKPCAGLRNPLACMVPCVRTLITLPIFPPVTEPPGGGKRYYSARARLPTPLTVGMWTGPGSP